MLLVLSAAKRMSMLSVYFLLMRTALNNKLNVLDCKMALSTGSVQCTSRISTYFSTCAVKIAPDDPRSHSANLHETMKMKFDTEQAMNALLADAFLEYSDNILVVGADLRQVEGFVDKPKMLTVACASNDPIASSVLHTVEV